MEIEGIKTDLIFKYQIQIKIDGRIFYSDKVFDCEEDAEQFMSFLSKNNNCNWISIPVLCPRKNINITDLISGQFYVDNSLENKSYNEIIKEEFKK